MNADSPGPLAAFHRLLVGRALWPLARGIPKSVSSAGIRPDSGLGTAEGQRLPLSPCLITSRKRIAFVAHDNQKEKLARWAFRQRARLIEHELYATAHTADVIAATLNVPVFRLLSGPLGGDQQIGSRIAESRIDVLVFFLDPLGLHPHDCDVKALLRLAAVYNIPNACNEATADCIISALARDWHHSETIHPDELHLAPQIFGISNQTESSWPAPTLKKSPSGQIAIE